MLSGQLARLGTAEAAPANAAEAGTAASAAAQREATEDEALRKQMALLSMPSFKKKPPPPPVPPVAAEPAVRRTVPKLRCVAVDAMGYLPKR